MVQLFMQWRIPSTCWLIWDSIWKGIFGVWWSYKWAGWWGKGIAGW